MSELTITEVRGKTWSFILNHLLEVNRDITEIETNGTTSLFIKKSGKRLEITDVFESPEDYAKKTTELVHLIRPEEENELDPRPKFIAEGRVVLNTGESARVHIVLPPACDYPQVTIAKKSNSLSTLDAIKATGSMNTAMFNFIKMAIDVKQTIILSGGSGAGKALHKDTIIPAPQGTMTVGALQVGDVIYDEDKSPTVIIAKYQPKVPDHYKVFFDNGEVVRACGDHLWQVNSALWGDGVVANTRTLLSEMELGSTFTVDRAKKQYREDVHMIVRIERYFDNPDDFYCFTVESPSHLYLCTESEIPTHNTTMLEAMSKYFDEDERIAVVEDAPELKLIQPNVTYLRSTVWAPGMDPNSVATLSWCVKQINRARCDKIIIGETRGGEFADFIVGANSGMEGSVTTIHADDPTRALEKMGQFVLIGMPQPTRSAQRSIANSIDLIIQLGFSKHGKNITKEISAVSRTLGGDESATIATQPIFKYNEVTDDWDYVGYLPPELKSKVEKRGYNSSTFLKGDHGGSSGPSLNMLNSLRRG